MSSGFSPLDASRYDFASRNWRISASRTSAEIGAEGPPVEPCGKSCSIESGPLPICLKASPESGKGEGPQRDRGEDDDEDHFAVRDRELEHDGRGYVALSLAGLSY